MSWFCLVFLRYRVFSFSSESVSSEKDSYLILQLSNIFLERESELIWLTNIKHLSRIKRFCFSYSTPVSQWKEGVASTSSHFVLIIHWWLLLTPYASLDTCPIMFHVQHVAGSFWLSGIWRKPQQITKQQKAYYSSTLHCLLSVITSSILLFDFFVTDTNLERSFATFCTLTLAADFPWFHFFLLFLHFFSVKWKCRQAHDSIYQPQLGLERVSTRPHLFPETFEAENRRHHNANTFYIGQVFSACGCVCAMDLDLKMRLF